MKKIENEVKDIKRKLKDYNISIKLLNQYALQLKTSEDNPLWLRANFYYADRYEILNLVIDKKYRKKGHGKKLVSIVEDFARLLGINKGVIPVNQEKSFWECMGYKNGIKYLS
ncbi:MAG: GNAT family N-acetyltransferase [Candidatus Pacearchaeota archaeon]